MLIVEAIAIGSVVWYVGASRRANQMLWASQPKLISSWRLNAFKPTVSPPVVKGAAAKIASAEIVVGVEVGGRSRAYCVRTMGDPSGHLVNDFVGGVPVSVACCNLSQTVRVYSDPKGSGLLDAEVVGLLNSQMVTRLGEHLYFHITGRPVEPDKNPPPIPYQVLPPIVTTWENWSKSHPDSDVFVGGR